MKKSLSSNFGSCSSGSAHWGKGMWLLAGLVLTTALHAQVATPFLRPFSFSPQAGNFGTFGVSFRVNAGYQLTVSDVGYWDENSNGVTGGVPISVALFSNTTQQIVAGSQIDFSGTDGGTVLTDPLYPSGVYRFEALSAAVVLTPGDYMIAEWNYGLGDGSDVVGNRLASNAVDTYDGAVTFIGTAYASGSVNGAFPSVHNSFSADFFAGNFHATAAPYSAVPEPGACAAIFGVLALGAAGVRVLRRCKENETLICTNPR